MANPKNTRWKVNFAWILAIIFALTWAFVAVNAYAEDYEHGVQLTGLVIRGPATVPESTTATYTATASFSDGTSRYVTTASSWSDNSSYVTISAGNLTALAVNGNQSVTLTARYSTNGISRTATLPITILNSSSGSVTLTGLDVKGPATVPEGTSAVYTANANFSDGTSRYVTQAATWSDNSSYVTISGGNLTASSVSGNQAVTVTASYTLNGVTKTGTLPITVTDSVVSSATLTSLSVTGPASISENGSGSFVAKATFSDNSTSIVSSAAVWTENSSFATIDSTGNLTTLSVTSDQPVTVTAQYTSGTVTRTASANTVIVNGAVAPPVTGSHAGRFTTYAGTSTCIQCHSSQANAMHASAHYQWKGSTRDLVSPAAATEGKLGGMNDFCIYPDINWIGKLTNVDGVQVDGGCSKCHTGLGDKPSPTVSPAQLENIDCLICHSPTYKRKVDLVNSVYKYVPDTLAMGTDILSAASNITRPSKATCLNCHTKSGGGDNYKRGDLEEAHRNPTAAFDIHMASTAMGGKGLECLNCHTASGHRIAGRGSDLRERDSTVAVTCQQCHTTAPHSNADINNHLARVNCTVCHIPSFAKTAPTDMERDWSLPGEVDAAKRLYDPAMTKQTNVTPVYKFWNGKSQFYNFGTPAVAGPSGRIEMSKPIGDITSAGSKIYAFKHHLGTQPQDPTTDVLLPIKIGIFNSTNNIASAITEGVKAMGWADNGYTFANTERYMGLFHEVAPKAQALQCSSCHGGTRLDFKALGYSPKTTGSNGRPLCSSCHSSESASFTEIHSRHVDGRGFDCSTCHNFSKAN